MHQNIKRLTNLLGGLALAFGFAISIAIADDHPNIAPVLSDAGWTFFAVPDKNPNRFTLSDEGAIEVYANASVSLLYRRLSNTEMQAKKLSWAWRVDEAVPETDLTQKGGDDRNMTVHVWFPSEPSLFQALGDLVASAVGAPPIGRSLSYALGGNAETVGWFPHPYMVEEGRMTVLRSSQKPLGQWFTEEVDLIADFEQSFGTEAPMPTYIAISSDSDDTGSIARARIKNIRFAE